MSEIVLVLPFPVSVNGALGYKRWRDNALAMLLQQERRMNRYWHGKYDDGVLVIAMDGVQVASVAKVDKSIDRMQVSLDLAVGTMSGVRDEVIKFTAKAGKSTVPPARRPATKARGA